jgi:hypothetical protein
LRYVRGNRIRIQDSLNSLIQAKGELTTQDALEILVGIHKMSLSTAQRWIQEMEMRRLIVSDPDGYLRPRESDQAPITD